MCCLDTTAFSLPPTVSMLISTGSDSAAYIPRSLLRSVPLLARLGELRSPHLRDRDGLEDPPVCAPTAREQRAHKCAEVIDRRLHTPRGTDAELKRRRVKDA